MQISYYTSTYLLLGVALAARHPTPEHATDAGVTYNASAQILTNPYPYDFPEQNVTASKLFPMPTCQNLTIEDATIDQLQGWMSCGKLTSVQFALCYLQRIYQTDDYINSVLEINPDFLEIAASLDAERASGKVRSNLHGIPFMVKDNIASKDRMQTTAGSWALQGSVVPRDAHVVKLLREAGALLFGKATLSEWADMRSNNYSEGYSGRGGQARSSYNFTVNCGGSSSGSAIGVSNNVFTFALGTETDGSVINPAERNAIVGIKPTVGLTSRDGVIPESEHQDTVGAFGKTVRDATYVLDQIYGVDSRDNYTSAQIGKTPAKGYSQFLTDKSALKNATFGLPWNSFWIYADGEQQRQLLHWIDEIEAAGATVVNNTELKYPYIVSPDGWNWDYGTTRGFVNESEYSYVKVDFYNNLAKYLSELENTSIRSVEDLVAYNEANDGTESGYEWPLGNPAFYSGQDGLLASLESKGIQTATYFEALAFCQRTTREDGIDYALAQGPDGTKLDGLIVPPDVAQAPQIAAQAGYPMITIPAGVHSASGMPFGLALMQTAFAEDKLVRYASAIEDLQKSLGFTRPAPRWEGYLERTIPLLNVDEGSP
ncbi:glutamyl-tRNA amidotransferase subunit A [Delphinella strobiligena]|nr:glutamyl-tRNA amidotransferase subunit A [Delphinella strobiligena]